MHIFEVIDALPYDLQCPSLGWWGVRFIPRIKDHILIIFNLLKRVKEVLGRRDMGVGWGCGAKAWKSRRYARFQFSSVQFSHSVVSNSL